MHWFDAHLDLACLALNGRDMTKPVAELTEADQGPWPPASTTLHSLAAGGVTTCLATIFTESGGKGPEGYAEGDAASAHEAGLRQLKVYEDWFERGLAHRAAFASQNPLPLGGVGEGGDKRRLAIGILMECADPIRSPDELAWWVSQGVCAIGLTWGNGSRYAGGNSKGEGLTGLGREMVRAMDANSMWCMTFRTCRSGRRMKFLSWRREEMIASHSNCRSLLGGETKNNGGSAHL
ncbi:MAG: membrane dipeptidase [Phycisphaerales bacterium]